MRLTIVVRMSVRLTGASQAHGQTATGEVSGTVTDPSGASIPRASVTLTSDETKASRTTLANQDGRFIFTNVLAGQYTVSVTASGFKKFEQKQVNVEVNQIVDVNYQLSVGNVEENVEVTASAAALQTHAMSMLILSWVNV